MKLAYFDCFSGVSGDMTLAALVSAGWPAEQLQALPGRLKLEGVTIEVSNARRGAFAAIRVDGPAPGRQPHRHLHHIEAILDAADLSEPVRARAKAVFGKLAAAEADVHGTTIQKVHFHEVGAVDSILDIVGAAVGLNYFGIDAVYASALPLGSGQVNTAHGLLPIPAPATAELIRMAQAPVAPSTATVELVTPRITQRNSRRKSARRVTESKISGCVSMVTCIISTAAAMSSTPGMELSVV